MRSAFSYLGWIVSLAFMAFALMGVFALVSSDSLSTWVRRAALFNVAGFITLAVITNPLIHDGRSALAVARDVAAGFWIAIGFFVLTYFVLIRFP
jgi:hypothetical protein